MSHGSQLTRIVCFFPRNLHIATPVSYILAHLISINFFYNKFVSKHIAHLFIKSYFLLHFLTVGGISSHIKVVIILHFLRLRSPQIITFFRVFWISILYFLFVKFHRSSFPRFPHIVLNAIIHAAWTMIVWVFGVGNMKMLWYC